MDVALFVMLGIGSTAACTSSKDSPALEVTEPQRVYRATPTVQDMNEQASSTNRKMNIEERHPNAPNNTSPETRTQKIMPGRQPVLPDTVSTRPRRATTKRKQ